MRCPTCEKMLPTEQGMRQHHPKVHGEPLPNRTCVDCGTEFYHAKAKRKFCYDCNHNAGENNGNWKDARETAECRLCGDSFEFYAAVVMSRPNGSYEVFDQNLMGNHPQSIRTSTTTVLF